MSLPFGRAVWFNALIAVLGMGLLLSHDAALADGSETLGTPSIGIATGTGIATGGVGLQNEIGSGTLEVTVPAGATINQVLLYWSGEVNLAAGPADDTVFVGATEVTGSLIGGPSFYFSFNGTVDVASFRADVTAEGFIGAGDNTLEISGLDNPVPGFLFNGNHGIGVLVIYSDAGAPTDTQVLDGLDIAFCGFTGDAESTIAQTFAFAPSAADRVADLALFFGSQASETNPHSISISDDLGNVVDLQNPLENLANGNVYTQVVLPVAVAAGASSITVHPRSETIGGSCPGTNPALIWGAAVFSLELPASCGDGVLDVGEECDDNNSDNFDGCRNDCTLPACGDEIQDPGEECDDGNNDDGDGCSALCELASCGDEIVDEGEACDDGNDDNFDGCRNDCTVPFCGDNIVDLDEQCDDGNNEDGDGCNMFCEREGDEELACRSTGGLGGYDRDEEEWNVYTAGGQASTVVTSSKHGLGDWTHKQHFGTAGRFSFYAGSKKGGKGSAIFDARCSDPGGCNASIDGSSPAKQLDFEGIGTFRSMSRRVLTPDFKRAGATVKASKGGKKGFKGTYHWFEVNLDDLGESRGWKSHHEGRELDDELCPPEGFGEKGEAEFGECDCPDFYRITIYDGVKANDIIFNDDDSIDPSQLNQTDVIYEVGGYIRNGNIQLHLPKDSDHDTDKDTDKDSDTRKMR